MCKKYRVSLRVCYTIAVMDLIFRKQMAEYNTRHLMRLVGNRRRAKMTPFRDRNRITHATLSERSL